MQDATQWLERNSFHHRDFADLEHLIELKTAQSLSISLVIPTLNEERNIGDVVRIVRTLLKDRHPLLDEILVVDSGSTDRTGERARAAGAEFIEASKLMPEAGDHPGKGENLWKSLSRASGDLICFIDADIQNMHPRFVYGLIGPLLTQPQLHYVKGFYERPMTDGSRILPNQGGRVTELLVRPLFSLFYPELTRFCQPLSGEYAARRSLLEELAFPTGYGVESAHLIDATQLLGIDALAQCDLEERVHRNRSLQDLSQTSHEILQCIMPRIERDGFLDHLQFQSTQLQQIESLATGLEMIQTDPDYHERPPLKKFLNLGSVAQ